MNAKEIGNQLRELRGVYRSQAEVAEAIGVTPAAVSLYETGERIPSDEVKLRLAKFYGVTVQELFFASE